MAKETFYEAVKSERYNQEELERIVFRMEGDGPKYKITFGKNYSNPKEAIDNDDFIVRMIFPSNHNINDSARKRNLLNLLYHNGRKI